ncbi:MAG: glycosyl hydrolase, partial [Verrucomicrobiales bacterium]|nr:glycosyl hydrolase [Verrucomicrobiales bacterium]
MAALFFHGTIHAEPLHVFLRGGKKTHGPGADEHEQFLKDTTKLLAERGIQVEGGMEFPSTEQLAKADVLLIYAEEGGEIPVPSRPAMENFLKKGGGVVVIHTAAVPSNKPGSSDYLKSIIGGSWVWGKTKWLEGPMALYFMDNKHPITAECSNFDMDDEIYYDFDLSPDIHVLAAAYTPNMPESRNPNDALARKAAESTAGGKRASVYDIQPQMWTYEKTWNGGSKPYRAFVSIPGHFYTNFSRLNYRAVLLRGIAWAGNRPNPDEFCNPNELASLRYPEGGPSRPQDSLAKAIVHPDFKMSIVAAEPLINKPINIDWDAQGRMWVAETVEYPNGRKIPNVDPWKDAGSLVREGRISDRPARDRISILSEVDADGVAHKKEVFYEGLELVTSFVHYKQGVIASAAPDIWLLQDTDGDGKADLVKKLYSGLGTFDTHAVINNLRWGYDGWIYATHGYSTGEHVKNAEGKDFGKIGSGVVRFKPDGTAIEQYSSKGGNTWGLDFGWDNELFYTQPTSGELVMNVVLPEGELARGNIPGTRSYKPMVIRQPSFPAFTSEKQAYVQIDLVGSFTASAGCAVYDGGAWPDKWRYSYFTTEPTINIVHHEIMTRSGVSFDPHKEPGREKMEFIASKDYWWRPIETRIGPDGALYICDFYNQAVIHNDTRGPKHGPANAAVRPDRDHYFGRIWKV